MDDLRTSQIDSLGGGFTRRGFLLGGVGAGLMAGIGALGLDFWFDSGLASADTSATYPLPSSTAPEQIHLTWGKDPARDVTVSWGTAGSVPAPDATVFYSPAAFTAANRGKQAAITVKSFTDGMSNQTTYYYHAPLTGLKPATRYYYKVSDGATPPSVVESSFVTAPTGRRRSPSPATATCPRRPAG